MYVAVIFKVNLRIFEHPKAFVVSKWNIVSIFKNISCRVWIGPHWCCTFPVPRHCLQWDSSRLDMDPSCTDLWCLWLQGFCLQDVAPVWGRSPGRRYKWSEDQWVEQRNGLYFPADTLFIFLPRRGCANGNKRSNTGWDLSSFCIPCKSF